VTSRTIVGVISDTHGLLRPEAMDALRGCDLILHAGDIGGPEILEELSRLAPVIAVRGNVDDGAEAWSKKLPQTAVAELGDTLIYLLHNRQQLDLDPAVAGMRAVVYGHSHKPMQEIVKGVLYFNPGSAGPRRFQLPISVGRLTVEGTTIKGELIRLG
jgi:uncharacterized protein